MAPKTRTKTSTGGSAKRGRAAAGRADKSSRSDKSPKPGGSKPARASGRSRKNALRSVVSRHRADLWGVVAALLGLLTAVSVWFEAAGPLGEALDDGLAWAVGLMRAVVPVVLLAVSVVLFRGRPTGGSDGETANDSERIARAALGGVLSVVAAAGLLHLARGRPDLDAPIEDIGAAGGALGWAIGSPLYKLAAAAGSVLLLCAAGVVGIMVLTGLSIRTVGGWIGRVLRPIPRLLSSAVKSLLADPTARPSETEAGPVGAEVSETPRDAQEADAEKAADTAQPGGSAPAKKRRPARKRSDVEPITHAEQQALSLPAGSRWKLPPADLLKRTESHEVDKDTVAERGRLLHYTLDQFGVPTTPLEPVVGPTVTRYVLELGEGVKVAKLESLRKDIAYAMASPDVRILAPIPGRKAIGVEVPNSDRQLVALGDVLASKEARSAKHPLEVAIGRDINGRNVMLNLATMPHVLIAGATGAGKSSCLNSVLTSILMRSTPDVVRLLLIDPKRVEMGQYERVPHLLTGPVTDPKLAANALAWVVREMERRYDRLHKVGFRDITGYNNAVAEGSLKAPLGELDANGEPVVYTSMPFVLVVVDELADLMMVAARDVEESIARIAQMARAVGIHLVIATQRPSVNVITGVIKANVPARLAFAVSSLTDSRVILDQPGAERLVGRGDLLMLGPASSSPHRIQGCWVTETEVRSVVAHWVDQAAELAAAEPGAATASASASAAITAPAATSGPAPTARPAGTARSAGPAGMARPAGISAADSTDSITEAVQPVDSDSDELLGKAMELVVQTQLGSTSMLQRKLRVGFARAGRIMDLLEEAGVVGPSTGSKAREVLVSPEELADRQSD